MSFEIKLPLFEGPFDLLLFFIERDELPIYDIPIAQITDEFVAYIRKLEQMNMEVASEFILVAATLMSIKAKMLIPRQQIDEKGNEIDPRDELIRHLVEYKKYKSVIGKLSELEFERSLLYERGNVYQELKKIGESTNVESELQDIDLYKLLKVFEKVVNRYNLEQLKPVHKITQYPYSIEEKKEFILGQLILYNSISFEKILTTSIEKIEVVYLFLAILELLQLNHIALILGEGYNNFWISINNEINSTDTI
jgi:segregation and condensation protein A